MADIVDIASDFLANELAYQVQRVRNNVRRGIMGPEQCVLCDSEIPVPRRRLGFEMCVHCAEEEERQAALYARD